MPVRILVADDNPQVRFAMREVLEAAGAWEVVEAENGEDAVAKAEEFKPALIILDLAMPVKDGLTASREISNLLPGTPILLHTLYSSPHIQIEAIKTGVRKVVPKSETTVLISAVQDLLNPTESSPPPSEDVSPIAADRDSRQRTEDRIRELCAQILSTATNDAPPPVLSELRDLLHTHIESLRARLAQYPSISERRAHDTVSPLGPWESSAAISSQTEKVEGSDPARETPRIADAEQKTESQPKSKASGER
jgi:DNA-binding NarL/FixJ family response regulator